MIINKTGKGFNLVELMVALTIMSIMMALSAPLYSAWITNMRIKNISEGINLGVTQARAEAIRRNQYVKFILENDTSWEISTINDEPINKKNAKESSSGIALTVGPVNSTTLTFNGFGYVTKNIDATDSITSIVVNSSTPISGVQPMTVKIGKGGGTLICSTDCATRNID